MKWISRKGSAVEELKTDPLDKYRKKVICAKCKEPSNQLSVDEALCPTCFGIMGYWSQTSETIDEKRISIYPNEKGLFLMTFCGMII